MLGRRLRTLHACAFSHRRLALHRRHMCVLAYSWARGCSITSVEHSARPNQLFGTTRRHSSMETTVAYDGQRPDGTFHAGGPLAIGRAAEKSEPSPTRFSCLRRCRQPTRQHGRTYMCEFTPGAKRPTKASAAVSLCISSLPPLATLSRTS